MILNIFIVYYKIFDNFYPKKFIKDICLPLYNKYIIIFIFIALNYLLNLAQIINVI